MRPYLMQELCKPYPNVSFIINKPQNSEMNVFENMKLIC